MLYVLGRGGCFGDASKMSHMSEATAQSAFHAFCRNFAVELFDEWVRLPTGDELTKVMDAYDDMGCPGAVGSAGVTRVAWSCAPRSRRRSRSCKRTKEGGAGNDATLAYQAIVGRDGRVLGVTRGFPGGQSDKSIARHDPNVQRIRESAAYRDRQYKLRNVDGTESVRKGLYLVVDGGCHKVNRALDCLFC